MENPPDYKSGYIAVIGRPNVGKSTIINRLMGERLLIVNPKPQTTRDSTLGILTTDTYQMIFIDTPGIHKPRTLLGEHMVRKARTSISNADIVIFVLEASSLTLEDMLVAGLLKGFKKPAFLLVNKIDTVSKEVLLSTIDSARNIHQFKELIPVSAVKGDNMDLLKEKIILNLEKGPQYYENDQLSDRDERFFVTEIIREQTLRLLQEEVPHSVAVKLEEMKDRTPFLSYVKATIYVERPSQKMIIVGKSGQKLKEIGTMARKRLEEFLNRKVYLDLWVKVYKNWRKNPAALKLLGY